MDNFTQLMLASQSPSTPPVMVVHPTTPEKVGFIVVNIVLFAIYWYTNKHKDRFSAFKLEGGQTINIAKWSSVTMMAFNFFYLLFLLLAIAGS